MEKGKGKRVKGVIGRWVSKSGRNGDEANRNEKIYLSQQRGVKFW